jgi:hypothetical protein
MKNFLRSMRMILARKLTPLKSVGLAFRKDKGDFKSGPKENNSCARDGAGAGQELTLISDPARLASLISQQLLECPQKVSAW